MAERVERTVEGPSQEKSRVTVLLREDARNPGHVRIRVFVGRNPGSRGCAGQLVLRTDEWDEICDYILTSKQVPMILNFSADKVEIKRTVAGSTDAPPA